MRHDTLILEGILTTIGEEGAVNIAPMGPRVDRMLRRMTLRPFRDSQTFRNLQHHGEGVFHVVDNVLLLAQAAVDRLSSPPPLLPATQVHGYILQDCCRFYELKVEHIDATEVRAEIGVRMVTSGKMREFFGFNRAKHAVVEAAILATRVHLLPRAEIETELQRLQPAVDKTGGSQEREAFQFIVEYIAACPDGGQPS
jgi:hypothetical protein